MGEYFVVFVKRGAVKAYLEKNGFSSTLFSTLFCDNFNQRWHVLADAFGDEFSEKRAGIEGKIIWAYITAKKYDRRFWALVDFFNNLFDMFGAENILVVSGYADFHDRSYVSLEILADKIKNFVDDSIKDYTEFLEEP